MYIQNVIIDIDSLKKSHKIYEIFWKDWKNELFVCFADFYMKLS
jgi:hypothetical protein